MADAQVPMNPPGAIQMPGAGDWRSRASAFTAQPAFRRALPAMVGVGAVAVIAALYLSLASGPQRILYSGLSDAERAQVVQTLEAGGISYTIDNSTGALSVAESDVYRARMLVASDAGLAAPQGASEMLDAIPLGSSRTLEGERLRLARERELMLTIREIDGIESVRVHLATPERSVFVRENNPPSASVMVRLASGRSLSQSQVEAIVNLVSGSVPGMTSDTVRVVDQNGRLLSSPREDSLDGLVLQREFESKLRDQLSALLLPLLGDGNFSSEVQVSLKEEEVTSARESYDSEGAVRSESERSARRLGGAGAGGVPGVAANTPPAETELVDGAPVPAEAGDEGAQGPTETENATQRNYELGREVAVTSSRPGGLVRLSVAVAVSDAALKAAAPMTAAQLQTLVSAAVGADEARGDKVEIVVSAFEGTEMPEMAFYEQPWFGEVLRYGAALIAVLLVLLLAVRPLIAMMRGPRSAKGEAEEAQDASANAVPQLADQGSTEDAAQLAAAGNGDPFAQRMDLARQLAATQPDRAVEALQRMLDSSEDEKAKAAAS